MVNIIAPYNSPRLSYTLNFIFRDYYGIAYTVTQHAQPEAINIHYGEVDVFNCGLLFENSLSNVQPEVVWINDTMLRLYINGRFDLFAAVFYLLSRYEEYLEYKPDKHGRFPAEASLAYQKNFLHLPIINTWLNEWAEQLKHKGVKINLPAFSYRATYDIDMAFAHTHKGFLRNIGGLIKAPGSNRLNALRGKEKDVYDIYDELTVLHTGLQLKPAFFFLLAAKTGGYDKNNPRNGKAMTSLIKGLDETNIIGIHPSYQSNGRPEIIKEEKEYLETVTGHPINSSRQHFLQLKLPQTFAGLISCGIKDEYSMGYATHNGFRASVARSFYWYDLREEKETALLLHPFCFMDANSYYQQKQSATRAFEELQMLLNITIKNRGEMITIFHNSILSRDKGFEGWMEQYSRFISRIKSLGH